MFCASGMSRIKSLFLIKCAKQAVRPQWQLLNEHRRKTTSVCDLRLVTQSLRICFLPPQVPHIFCGVSSFKGEKSHGLLHYDFLPFSSPPFLLSYNGKTSQANSSQPRLFSLSQAELPSTVSGADILPPRLAQMPELLYALVSLHAHGDEEAVCLRITDKALKTALTTQ